MHTLLTIQEKLKNLRKEINHSSIAVLAKLCILTADYLLGLLENKKPANSDLLELHFMMVP